MCGLPCRWAAAGRAGRRSCCGGVAQKLRDGFRCHDRIRASSALRFRLPARPTRSCEHFVEPRPVVQCHAAWCRWDRQYAFRWFPARTSAGVHGQDVARVDEADGNRRHTGFDGDVGGAFLERAQCRSCVRPPSGKQQQGNAVLARSAWPLPTWTFSEARASSAHHRKMPGAAADASRGTGSENRPFLAKKRNCERHRAEDAGRVHVTGVVRDQHVAARRVELFVHAGIHSG